MSLDRRRLFAALAGAATAGATAPALARDVAARSPIDATTLGLRPNAPDDQSKALQRAIDQAAAAGTVLHLPAGFYRAGALNLPQHAAIAGVAGMTRIVMAGGPSMLSAIGSDNIALSGLILDGANIPLPERRGLIHLAQGRALRIADCEIVGAGRNGIALEAIDGEVTGTTISAADNAIFSIDARGLRIAGNTVRSAGNGGILVWRSTAGDDGTLVVDNRIENIANKSGGSGQYGNAINVFRANNVMVRGNRIRNAAFSAVRGNAASNLQILGNTCSAIGEVALYAEFGFEGAMIANNIVDGAALGVSVTNFNEGGRLAVVQGNLIRNLMPPARRHRPERQRRHRHRYRSRHRGERQRHRERALYRHRRRLGPISARRDHQRQRHTRRRLRHRSLGRPRRRRRRDRRQYDLRRPPRRHRRHGMEKAGDRRPRKGRRRALRAIIGRSATGCGDDRSFAASRTQRHHPPSDRVDLNQCYSADLTGT